MADLKKMRVLIAEDQALVRQGMAALLSDIVSDIVEVENGEQALKHLKSENFDIALLDIGLPRRTGLDVLQELRRREMDIQVIVLTGDTDSYSPSKIYGAGADGFLYKTADAGHFLETFSAIARGIKLPENHNLTGQNAKEVAELRQILTERELQIVKLIVEGKTNKQVAGDLFISEHTVRKHREHINTKLNVRSPLALAHFAIKSGLV